VRNSGCQQNRTSAGWSNERMQGGERVSQSAGLCAYLLFNLWKILCLFVREGYVRLERVVVIVVQDLGCI
jgi:hypothetical protein